MALVIYLQCIAFRDVDPAAPTHILVIPRNPIPMLEQCGGTNEDTEVKNDFCSFCILSNSQVCSISRCYCSTPFSTKKP